MSSMHVCANANIMFVRYTKNTKRKGSRRKKVNKCCLVLLYSLIFCIRSAMLWVETEEPIKFIQLTCFNWHLSDY